MIILVTGKIGGGKTYWCVNYLIEKYYEYKQSIFQYVPNRKNIRIVTNIDSLDLPHEDLEKIVDEKGLQYVFNKDYVGSDSVVFIIDEAQRPKYFHRKFYDPKVFEFFQMSRHYGCDVLLITQDVNSLSRELKFLCEFEVRAMPRSRRTQNMFVYQYLAEDEKFKQQLLKFDKKIGALYRSQSKDETSKVPRVWKPYAIGVSVAVVLVLFGFWYFIHSFSEMGKPKVAHAKEIHKKLIGAELPKTAVGLPIIPENEVKSSNPSPGSKQEKEEKPKNNDNSTAMIADHNKKENSRNWLDGNLEARYFDDLKNGKAGNILKDASGRVTGYVIYH